MHIDFLGQLILNLCWMNVHEMMEQSRIGRGMDILEHVMRNQFWLVSLSELGAEI